MSDSSQPDFSQQQPPGVRLQKVLAQAGLGSRRACEQLIEQGRVQVDGVRVEAQGVRVDPHVHTVSVDGQRIVINTSLMYLVVNKPRGMLTTMADPQARLCIGDLLEDIPSQGSARLLPVGRLDADTEGLLLVTNDGDFAHHVTHPSFEVRKVYRAVVPGPVSHEVSKRLLEGVQLEDGLAQADTFRVISDSADQALVEMALHSGRNRIVRRMLEAVDHPVQRLVRTRIGQVRLGALKPGRWRELSAQELTDLYPAPGQMGATST